MKANVRLIGACACICVLLAGCGLKGPLKLPPKKPASVPATTAPPQPGSNGATAPATDAPKPSAAATGSPGSTTPSPGK